MPRPITPRYGHPPMKMERHDNPDTIGKAGDFGWSEREGVRYIIVALPRPTADHPFGFIINNLPVGLGGNVQGLHWGWNGDEDKPTLTPSVDCWGHWHGHILAGMLVEA